MPIDTIKKRLNVSLAKMLREDLKRQNRHSMDIVDEFNKVFGDLNQKLRLALRYPLQIKAKNDATS